MSLEIKHPQKEDGEKVWKLIKELGGLDLNSSYCYFMLCDYFNKSCAVAVDTDSGQLLGFISTYVAPENKETLFVWQVAVAKAGQGQGISKKLLNFVIEANKDIRKIETTIGPSNAASDGLFRSIARNFEAEIEKEVYLDENNFKEGEHETELLYKIGPLKR